MDTNLERLKKNFWALTEAAGWFFKAVGNIWQVLSCKFLVFCKKQFWNDIGLVNQNV